MVFIRGPIIERAGPDVEVSREYAGSRVVQRDNIMAATFHPELTDDPLYTNIFWPCGGADDQQQAARSPNRGKRKKADSGPGIPAGREFLFVCVGSLPEPMAEAIARYEPQM